jgi:predicted transcriptional regulator of viral defense system
MLLNGKHTNRAGVTRTRTQWGHEVDATDKERTLIDIVVRPAYAGGIQQVADAYVKEARRINVDYMVDLLRQLDHAYPYNQAIGFLLERAGLSGTDCHKFETSGMELDFYLDYGMKEPTFSKKWHLYYPAYLGERTN